MDAVITGHGPRQMADEDICRAIGEDLTQTYPGYLWQVGCNHDAGVATILLIVPTAPRAYQTKGFMIHLNTVVGPGGSKKVRDAGGEILERWGLPRGRAPSDYMARAGANGLDTANSITKSRY